MVVHAYNCITERLRQKDCEFKITMRYKVLWLFHTSVLEVHGLQKTRTLMCLTNIHVLKVFCKMQWKGKEQNLFHKTVITLIPKPNESTTKKES
jgi:hypothetical protein